jgi:glycine/D-amino acid oxidase-like deaminating enzyme/nitrite reductase/ring-hydroxylating ferredoxin subunit
MNTPYWSDTASLPHFPRLKTDLHVDVVIIGGGITGITAAYLLKKAGATFALLERDQFASADTGCTTAHITCVTDTRLDELVDHFGRDHALAVWDAGQAAIDQIREIVTDQDLDCEWATVPGYLHLPPGKLDAGGGMESLKKDVQLAKELGIDAALLERIPLFDCPGIRFPNQAKFHPRKYLAGLLKVIKGEGCHVCQESPVDEILENPLRVRSGKFTIRCGHIFIATHVPLQGLAGTLSAMLFQTKLSPYTSYAVGARVPSGTLPEACFWDTKDPYDYVRIDQTGKDNYVIYGGEDHKTGQVERPSDCFESLESKVVRLIPGATIDHRWSGQVIETADGLPFIGPVTPEQYVATGFSGNGMTFGTLAAMMFSDTIANRRNPWQDLFDVNRKVLRGGTWDYLKENKDFPYYFLKDRLAKARAKSTRSIKRGEGQVVDIEGSRVAAYRDEDGNLTKKSAVCTHLGCLVHWNEAEKTWDCPCHGSRFKPTGEVVAGPAEKPLEDA